MGKVGSTSVYKAIKATRRFRTLHTHQLNRKMIDAYCISKGRIPEHIEHSLRFLNKSNPADRVKLIIGIRNPMSRNMSAFFENLDRFGGGHEGEHDANQLVINFTQKYVHHVPNRWFRTQVEVALGLKLFEPCLEYPTARFDWAVRRTCESP